MPTPRKVLAKNVRAILDAKIEAGEYTSYEHFALSTGFDKSHLSKILRGLVSPTLDKLVELARDLDVTLNDLYQMDPMGRKKK